MLKKKLVQMESECWPLLYILKSVFLCTLEKHFEWFWSNQNRFTAPFQMDMDTFIPQLQWKKNDNKSDAVIYNGFRYQYRYKSRRHI